MEYIYENNEFYKNYFESENLTPYDIKKPEDMEKLPITDKETYRNNFKKIISKNISKKDYIIASTSGSTGKPFTHYMDKKKEMLNTYIAFILNKESMSIKPFEKNNELRIHFHPPNEIKDFRHIGKKSYRKKILDHFFSEVIGIRSHTINPENSKDILRIIKKKEIEIIYGFPSAILNLSRLFSQLDLNDVCIKAIITIGESLFNYQRKFISKIFNCPVFMDYGSSECMRMGFECKKQNGFHMDIYNYFFEYLNKKIVGGIEVRAELITTNLNNYVFPFIRYKTNDSVILSDDVCNCGINLPLIKNIKGRIADIIYNSKGNQISSTSFAGYFEYLEERIPAVNQFQVIKKQNNELIVKIIPTNKFNEKVREIIQKELNEIMGKDIRVIILPVQSIKPEPSGKTKVLIIE